MPRFPEIGRTFVPLAAAVLLSSLSVAPSRAASSKTTKATAVTTTTAKGASSTASGTAKPNVKADVEAKLASLQQQASPGLKVGKATCPAEMAKVQVKSKTSASKPQTFRCTVLVEGVAAPYDVEIRDGGFLNGGSFLMSRAKAIIDVSKVVAGTIAQLDAADRTTAKVTCGKAKVLVASIGDTITCTVDYGGDTGSQKLVYEVKDLDGTISLRL